MYVSFASTKSHNSNKNEAPAVIHGLIRLALLHNYNQYNQDSIRLTGIFSIFKPGPGNLSKFSKNCGKNLHKPLTIYRALLSNYICLSGQTSTYMNQCHSKMTGGSTETEIGNLFNISRSLS